MPFSNLTIHWQGPFALVPGLSIPMIYDQDAADEAGLYLWITEIDGRPYLHYVGIASASGSIATRQRKHMSDYLGGIYTLYDPESFRRGEKQVLYSNDDRQSFGHFIRHIQQHHQAAMSLAGCMKVHTCRLDLDKPQLQRIESAVIRQLRETEGDAAKMLDNARLSRRVEPAQRIRVSTRGWPDYVGRPDWLEV